MPWWLLPNKEGYLSFTASKDLYKKIVALVVSVVFRKERKSDRQFCLESFVNGKGMRYYDHDGYDYPVSCLDHVWLDRWEPCELWGGLEDAFGANDKSQFQVMITAGGTGAIVTKCGFCLICKPLEEDLEILLKDDQLLDPALVYEIRNEDCQTSLEEANFAKPGLATQDTSTVERCRYSLLPLDHQHVSPGGEIPEEFILVEDGTISFMASQDLYDKFQGLALCVVVGVEGREKEISFDIVPHIHGQRRNGLSGTLGSFDSDQVWIQYLMPNTLWGVLEGEVDFGQFNERYLRFSIKLSLSGGTVKRLGYVLHCTRLEDDLKVMLEDNQLVDPPVLYEDGDGHPCETVEEFIDEFIERNRKPVRVKQSKWEEASAI